MNTVVLFLGLLLLSYLGSFLVGGRGIRGFGLPSGAEYVLLGFFCGPTVLGLVDHAMLQTFEPLIYVALGWLSLLVGLDYGYLGGRRLRPVNALLGLTTAIFTGSAIAFATSYMLSRFADINGVERTLLAWGAGASCAETTRHAVKWVVEHHRAKGPVSAMIGEVADSDDLVPILATSILFALAPSSSFKYALPVWGFALVTIGLGALIGLMAAALLGREFRLQESWGVLLGTSMLAVGLSTWFHLATMAVLFFLGLTISVVSRHRHDVLAMVAPTEHAVLLPLLLLAGAETKVPINPQLACVIAAAVLARVASKWLFGWGISWLTPAPRKGGAMLGFGLLSTGALAMSIGLSFALRFPGRPGDTILTTAAIMTVLGEFIGPSSLRASLRRAGETSESSPLAAEPFSS